LYRAVKRSHFVLLVLAHASLDVVGHSDIEVVRSAGHDVDRITMFSHTTILLLVRWAVCVLHHRAVGPQIPPLGLKPSVGMTKLTCD